MSGTPPDRLSMEGGDRMNNKEEGINMNDSIYDLINSLYREEVNNYNNYMANNPGDNQRTKDHILISSTYCKILYSIKEVIK